MIKNSILNILGCISFFSILWIVVFFGLGEFNHFVLRDVKEAKIVVEQNPKYSNIYCLECFQENLYCMSESKSKILVYDFQGNYVKTLQLPYSSTGYDYISINKNKLYIDCANGDTYEYDGTELTKCKKKNLPQLEKTEVICRKIRYYIIRNKLMKEENKRETVIQSENLLLWSVSNANITSVVTIILLVSLFFIKKLF